MRILFLNHGDSQNNSFHHIAEFAGALRILGHECVIVCHGVKSAPAPELLPCGTPVQGFRDIAEIMRDFQPDILHAWTPREPVRLRLFEALRCASHLPAVVVHLEDNEEEILRRAKLHDPKVCPTLVSQDIWRDLLALCDGCTLIVDTLGEFVPPHVSPHVLSPLLDAERFDPERIRRQLPACLDGLPGDAFLVGYTGNDNPANKSDMQMLFAAMQELRNRGCPAKLVRTGNTMPSHLEGLGFDPSPFLVEVGCLPWDEIPGLLAACHALVQPGDASDAYNRCRLPSKIPEYLLSGRPVVTSFYPGLSLEDGRSACLPKLNTPDALADAIESLWRHPEQAAEIGAQGRQYAIKAFCDPEKIQGLASFYKSCAGRVSTRCGLRFLATARPNIPPPNGQEWPSVRKFMLIETGSPQPAKAARAQDGIRGQGDDQLKALSRKYKDLKRRHEKLKRKAASPRVICSAGLDACVRLLGRFEPMRLDRFYHHTPVEWPLEKLVTKPGGFSEQAPLISLVIPSYNQAAYIGRTIGSIFSQQYPAIEVIVQDGGSTDGSLEVISSYASALRHWESASDNGQTHALNKGFAKSSGTIMGWLNSDDQLAPGALATIAAYFNRHPEIDAVYGFRAIVNEEDHLVGHWAFPPVHRPEVIDLIDYIPQETMFWRRSLWEAVGSRLDENFQFAMDWELILRFIHAGARFALIPRFLGVFRAHANQKSSILIDGCGLDEMKLLRQRQRGDTISWHTFQRTFQRLQILGSLRSIALRLAGRLPNPRQGQDQWQGRSSC